MSDNTQNHEDTQQGERIAGLPVTILAQYVKDLSFENPNAPATLRRSDERPAMDASFAMDARKVPWEGRDNIYEVSLGIRTVASKGDKTAFICEIDYGILVELRDIPEEQHHAFLLIEMPRYAFPFVRQIIATQTQQAGYMPLLLAPVDFRALYLQQFGDEMRRQQEEQQAAMAMEAGNA